MSKKAVYHHLEHPQVPSQEPDEEALLALLKEVEALPEQDPGDTYWHYFEGRLQKRLDQLDAEPVRRRTPWLVWLGFALAAALISFAILPTRNQAPVELAMLEDEQLQMIALIYPSTEDETTGELDAYAEDLQGIYGDENEYDVEGTIPDAATLQKLLEEEG